MQIFINLWHKVSDNTLKKIYSLIQGGITSRFIIMLIIRF